MFKGLGRGYQCTWSRLTHKWTDDNVKIICFVIKRIENQLYLELELVCHHYTAKYVSHSAILIANLNDMFL